MSKYYLKKILILEILQPLVKEMERTHLEAMHSVVLHCSKKQHKYRYESKQFV